ncbi:MAG TPA: hypothetical protein VND62_11735 [Acidimicrobiales bacterium]|nr:hypothetical protein [Acidimicrobiales bacterium]
MVTQAVELEHPGRAVFVADVVDVTGSAELVSAHLSVGEAWLSRLATAAVEDAATGPARPRRTTRAGRRYREVCVRLGREAQLAGAVVVPMRWQDGRGPHPFPVLDGNLHVAPLGEHRSRLVLYASYRPAFGWQSELDGAVAHEVATTTVRSFLERVAGALQG